MKIDPVSGLLNVAKYVPTQHCDARPPNTTIDLVVIHGISLPPAEWTTSFIEAFFCGRLNVSAHPYFATLAQLQVSAHLLIDRRGEIIQFVPFMLRAWHAGQSVFQGRSQCNDFSIGIELVGTDDIPYEPIQYQQLAKIIALLRVRYPAILDRVVGHSTIAPGRKTDPGLAFDWHYLSTLEPSHQ